MVRSQYSIRRSLIEKAKEAALTAVQAYNNPLTRFKSESFIVLMMVAWTYLLHAYFRQERIEYRYYDQRGLRRRFRRNPDGSLRYWDLMECLDQAACPLDGGTKANLRLLHGLRNKIEHHMPPALDDHLAGRYLACTMNFEYWLTTLCGVRHSLSGNVALALQFGDLYHGDVAQPPLALPASIGDYIRDYETALPTEDFDSERYKLSLLFQKVAVGKPGQADRVIQFMASDDPRAADLSEEQIVIRETEREKYRPSDVVATLRAEGYPRFSMHHHTELWKAQGAKNAGKGLGVWVRGTWFWYDRWVQVVRQHCVDSGDAYT